MNCSLDCANTAVVAEKAKAAINADPKSLKVVFIIVSKKVAYQ
jgi:hypothetical protein